MPTPAVILLPGLARLPAHFDDASALLIASGGRILLWQSGRVEEGVVRFSPHGWSDFVH